MKVTEDRISAVISEIEFIRPNIHPTLTLCVITLNNGYCVVGESACVDPKEFNEMIGKDIAYQDARRKIWRLEGYLLSQVLYIDKQFANSPH